MAHPFTFPAVAASLMLALAGGIQLGESTIGMINPVHFQGPAVHPRDRGAAIDERQLRAAQPSFASLYGWNEGNSARVDDCGNCEAIVARDSYAEFYEPEVTVHRATIQSWDEPSDEEPREGQDDRSEIQIRDFEAELKQRVARYAYYEIETPEVSEADSAAVTE